MQTIAVNTAEKYDVVLEIGALGMLGELTREVAAAEKVCLISDKNVFALYGEHAAASLERAGFDVHKIVFPEGEATKSIYCLEQILEYLAENQFTRSDIIAALGGGVIGDLAGFAAASFLRGIGFIQVPTTLLAAVDSSIGGKTAVNLKSGKNLAGAFHQPLRVVFDPACISSLPAGEFKNGMGEVIKSGVIGDADLFYYCRDAENTSAPDFIETIVSRSINVKRTLVEKDEHELGVRKLLNFGHTMGHAIELCSEFTIPHGRAVAMGMIAMARAAGRLGWSNVDTTHDLERIMIAYDIDAHCPYDAKALTEAALRDKKRRGRTISLVIPLEIGECGLMDVNVNEIEKIFRMGIEQTYGY